MNETTKRFPRTLNEAFPGTEPWSVYGPYKKDFMCIGDLVLAALLVLIAAVMVVVLV